MTPGEVYWAITADGTRHPVIVVSRRELNRGGYVLVVPTTTRRFQERERLPNCVPFNAGDFCFEAPTVVQAENITLLEHSDLDLEEGPLATLNARAMRSIIRAVGYVVEAECEPE